MWIQRMMWLLERMLFWLLLLPLLVGIIYTLSHDQWKTALIFIVLCVLVLYKGLIRIKILENSVVVRDGKVVFFIPEKTVRNRFDFASRGQIIVQLPHYGLLNWPYKLEIFYLNESGGIISCRLSLNLGYVMDLAAWQRLYDNYVQYHEQLSLVVKQQLFKSSAHIATQPPLQDEKNMDEYLKPIIAELDRGLEYLGLKIKDATCTFTAGPTLVRFVATEQELVEKD